jgi:hypothetical protein
MAKLSKAELTKREDIIMKMKKNKRNLVKKYGQDAEKVMYGRATNIAKKLAEQDMEQNKLREMVKAALMSPVSEKKGRDMDGDGDVDSQDYLAARDAAIKKTMKKEDLDLGHQDNEPHMLKGDLYRIGKYAMELYQMVDEFEGKGEVDFPHWWQAKVINARKDIESAKHYLDFETKEPEIDAAVDVIDMSGVLNNIGVDDEPKMEPQVITVNTVDDEDEIEEGLPKGYWSKKIEGGVDESYETLVKKIKGQGKSEKAAKAIAGAVASYKAKGGGKGPTAKQKK